MSTVALSGSDSFNQDDHIFSDFADGNFFEINFPNDIANVKVGKNGNALFSLNETGRLGEGILRLIRGSGDDKYLNAKLNAQVQDFAATVLYSGTFTKRIGHGDGTFSLDTYIYAGGVFTKPVGAKSNAEGDTEQSVAIYNFKFAKVARAIT